METFNGGSFNEAETESSNYGYDTSSNQEGMDYQDPPSSEYSLTQDYTPNTKKMYRTELSNFANEMDEIMRATETAPKTDPEPSESSEPPARKYSILEKVAREMDEQTRKDLMEAEKDVESIDTSEMEAEKEMLAKEAEPTMNEATNTATTAEPKAAEVEEGELIDPSVGESELGDDEATSQDLNCDQIESCRDFNSDAPKEAAPSLEPTQPTEDSKPVESTGEAKPAVAWTIPGAPRGWTIPMDTASKESAGEAEPETSAVEEANVAAGEMEVEEVDSMFGTVSNFESCRNFNMTDAVPEVAEAVPETAVEAPEEIPEVVEEAAEEILEAVEETPEEIPEIPEETPEAAAEEILEAAEEAPAAVPPPAQPKPASISLSDPPKPPAAAVDDRPRRSRRGSRVNYAQLNDGFEDTPSLGKTMKAGEEEYVEPKRSPRRSPRKNKRAPSATATVPTATNVASAPVVDRNLLDTSENRLNVNVFVPREGEEVVAQPPQAVEPAFEPPTVEETPIVQTEEPTQPPKDVEMEKESEMIPEVAEEAAEADAEMIPEVDDVEMAPEVAVPAEVEEPVVEEPAEVVEEPVVEKKKSTPKRRTPARKKRTPAKKEKTSVKKKTPAKKSDPGKEENASQAKEEDSSKEADSREEGNSCKEVDAREEIFCEEKVACKKASSNQEENAC